MPGRKAENRMTKKLKVDREMVLKLRTELGWSREQLAEKAELDIKTVERVESGQGVKLATTVAVAQALGVAIETLALERE